MREPGKKDFCFLQDSADIPIVKSRDRLSAITMKSGVRMMPPIQKRLVEG